MMSSIELVLQSLEILRSREDEFSSSFYKNLFAARPDFKPHFANTDMEKQRHMLMSALMLLGKNLQNPQLLARTVKSLGERHNHYGASPEYFKPFGDVLLATIADCLGPKWSDSMEKAWLDAYQSISQLMLEGVKTS